VIAKSCCRKIDPTELRKVDVRLMMAEDDSALDIANHVIRAGRYCMEQQRKRLAKGKIEGIASCLSSMALAAMPADRGGSRSSLCWPWRLFVAFWLALAGEFPELAVIVP